MNKKETDSNTATSDAATGDPLDKDDVEEETVTEKETTETTETTAEVVDELPADLQPGLVDPDDYLFPNNNRRRIPGYLYLGFAAASVLIYVLFKDSVLVNKGVLFAAAILAVVGLYSLVSGWNLDIDEQDALVASIEKVGFPVGHASAQMGWRGLLSRPTWRILVYSADNPTTKRGLVLIDGVTGEVVEYFVEDNPEDWSDVES